MQRKVQVSVPGALALLISARLAAATPPAALAPGDDPWSVARDSVARFDDRHGLPQNSVSSLAFDAQGRLWAGTQDGLARFDGRAWEVFDLPERSQSNWVRALAVGADGAVWAGSNHGVFRRDAQGAWTAFHLADGLPGEMVRSLLVTREDAEEVLYAGTASALGRYAGGSWTAHPDPDLFGPGPPLRLLATAAPDGSQVLWAATTRQGLAVRRDGRWSRLGEPEGLFPGGVRALAEQRLADGTSVVWVGFVHHTGVARIGPHGVDLFPAGRDGFPDSLVLDLAVVRVAGRDEVWAATASAGIARFDGVRWSLLDRRSGLPIDTFWRLLPWPSPLTARAVFAGSDGAGLLRLDLGSWRSLAGAPGLASDSAYAITETAAGAAAPRFVVGTTESGLFEFRGGAFRRFGPPAFATDGIQALLASRDATGGETLWVGTSTKGLWHLDRRGWHSDTMPFEGPVPAVRALLASERGDAAPWLWVGTRSGFALRRPDGVFERQPWTIRVPGQQTETLFAIAETVARDGRRTLWLASEGGGLIYLRDGVLARVAPEHGVPNPMVVDLLVEPLPAGRSRLWLATGGGGAAWLDPDAPEPRLEHLDDRTHPSLPNNSLYALARDAQGRIYFLTNRGVARLTPGPDGDPRTGTLRTFTTEDGLPSNEGNQGAAYVDGRGRVWVGTVRGLAVFDPATEIVDRAPKPLYFARTLVGGAERRDLDGGELAHDETSLAIEYGLASFLGSDASLFRSELSPLDAEPRDWTRATRREFTTLPAGNYRFRVWGRDALGNESGPIELAFRVRPAPWLAWPAMVGYALLLGAALRGAHLLRLRQVERRFAVVVAERNRMARELHDTVMQSLAGISLQLDEAEWRVGERPTEARGALARSRQLVASAHTEVRRSVWGLRAGALEDQSLPSALLAQAQQLARGTGITVVSRVAGEARRLAPELELELLRIGQEATTNALKHGRARCIVLETEFAPGRVRLIVRDDGRGFARRPGEGDGGFGLAGMRERAAAIGARLDIASRPGGGTVVTVGAPAPALTHASETPP